MNETTEVVALLQRSNELLSLLVKFQLREVVEAELAEPMHKQLYALTGIGEPVKKIAAKLNSSTGTISKIWQRWEKIGLLEKKGKIYVKVLQ